MKTSSQKRSLLSPGRVPVQIEDRAGLRRRTLGALLLHEEELAFLAGDRRRTQDEVAEIFEHGALRLADVAIRDASDRARQSTLESRD